MFLEWCGKFVSFLSSRCSDAFGGPEVFRFVLFCSLGTHVEQGHIPTIIASYQDSIKQLEDKISSETARIDLWEQREKLKYARLEQTLTEYNQKLSQISSYSQSLSGQAS